MPNCLCWPINFSLPLDSNQNSNVLGSQAYELLELNSSILQILWSANWRSWDSLVFIISWAHFFLFLYMYINLFPYVYISCQLYFSRESWVMQSNLFLFSLLVILMSYLRRLFLTQGHNPRSYIIVRYFYSFSSYI